MLGSNGSVLEIFKQQIIAGVPITLTHNEMTRFVMSESEAADLVLAGFSLGLGGEVLITKMPAIRIVDLAHALINLMNERHKLNYTQKVTEIGIKPGEKLYEELMTDEEKHRSCELSDFYSVAPTFEKEKTAYFHKYGTNVHNSISTTYNSMNQEKLSITEIEKLLMDYDLV